MSYDKQPRSPEHPAPDAETQLPEQALSIDDSSLLELNPGLAEGIDGDDDIEYHGGTENLNDNDNRDSFQPSINTNIQPSISIKSSLPPGKLSAAQQARFIAYVDGALLQIQRRFVQSFALSELGYAELKPLIDDLQQLVDFVWLSVEAGSSFGQAEYLLTIANDLLDYIVKLPVKDVTPTATALFELMLSLDTKFAKLIDSSTMNTTQTVRACGIAERSRIAVASVLERYGITSYHYELATLYEQVIERST